MGRTDTCQAEIFPRRAPGNAGSRRTRGPVLHDAT